MISLILLMVARNKNTNDEVFIGVEYYSSDYNFPKNTPLDIIKYVDICNNMNDNNEYKYIELSNIDNTGNIRGYSYEYGKNLPSRARRKIKENDVIVSSVEGSIDKIALVSKEFNDSLCSTGFYVLNSNVMNSETLLVLFKNKTIQQLLKQKCSGTILMGINKIDFLSIHLPIISLPVQKKIKTKINESFMLKEQSKQLLKLAKDIMNNAIENKEINLKNIDSKIKLICETDNKS